MNKKQQSLLSIIIIFFILGICLLFFVLPKVRFSDNENRVLAQFPSFSFDALVDGSFIKDFESYLTDHFPLRDLFVTGKTESLKGIGRSYQNGVYFGKNNYLFGEYKKGTSTQNIYSTLNRFKENNPDVKMNFLLVPTSISIYSEYLPNFVESTIQEKDFLEYQNNINFPVISLFNSFRKIKDDYSLYYKTDHHWTSYGAYFAYVEFCNRTGLIPYSIEDFEIEEVSNDFYGTYYSKVNEIKKESDIIAKFTIPNTSFLVDYQTTKKKSLYEEKYLSKKDKYSYFLDNNHPLITISNETIKNQEEILVIKDSYANSFLPFLSLHYKKIHVIDPRYYKASISEYIKENDISQVLFLYNLGNIDSDLGTQTIR